MMGDQQNEGVIPKAVREIFNFIEKVLTLKCKKSYTWAVNSPQGQCLTPSSVSGSLILLLIILFPF